MELREELPGDMESVGAVHRQAFGGDGWVAGLVDSLRELTVSSFHGRGIGSALVRRGLEMLAERGAPLVFLEGDPGYYSRFGFVPGGEHGFRKPSLRIPDAGLREQPPRSQPRRGGQCRDPSRRHEKSDFVIRSRE